MNVYIYGSNLSVPTINISILNIRFKLRPYCVKHTVDLTTLHKAKKPTYTFCKIMNHLNF